jgi:hypothetical protein
MLWLYLYTYILLSIYNISYYITCNLVIYAYILTIAYNYIPVTYVPK